MAKRLTICLKVGCLKEKIPFKWFPWKSKEDYIFGVFFCYNYNCICLLSVRVCNQCLDFHGFSRANFFGSTPFMEPKGYFNQHAYTCHVHCLSNLIWMCIWCVLICNHKHCFSADEFLSCPPKKRPGVGVRVGTLPKNWAYPLEVTGILQRWTVWLFVFVGGFFLNMFLTPQVPRVDFFLQRRLGFGGVDYQLPGMWRHAVDLIWLSRNRIAVNSFEVRILLQCQGCLGVLSQIHLLMVLHELEFICGRHVASPAKSRSV